MCTDHTTILSSDRYFSAAHIAGISWKEKCIHTVNEGTASLYYPKLKEVQDYIPDDVMQFFRTQYENALIYKDIARQILRELQPALSATGQIIITQGMALSETSYQEPMCRSMGDIDFYLPDGNVSQVRKIFIDYGFKQYRDYRNVLYYKQIMVDLHTGLWGTDRFIQRESIIPIQHVKTVPSRLIPGFFVLCPKHLALHCGFHGIKHTFSKEIWFLDLLRLFNEGYLTTDAENRQEYALKYLVFEYLANRHIVPAHSFKNRRYHISLFTKGLMKKISKIESPGSGQIALTLLCPTFKKWFGYVSSIILPPKKILYQMYGRFSYPVLVGFRMWDIITYAGRVFRKVVIPRRQVSSL